VLEVHSAGSQNVSYRRIQILRLREHTESSLFAMKTRSFSSILPSPGKSTMNTFINSTRNVSAKYKFAVETGGIKISFQISSHINNPLQLPHVYSNRACTYLFFRDLFHQNLPFVHELADCKLHRMYQSIGNVEKLKPSVAGRFLPPVYNLCPCTQESG
jgi:hypothetical protein